MVKSTSLLISEQCDFINGGKRSGKRRVFNILSDQIANLDGKGVEEPESFQDEDVEAKQEEDGWPVPKNVEYTNGVSPSD
ncbi:hypothetical protein BEWA_036990 [Theileria equi strain WA]|uniref:Uncharacterized protein n=1 Tax=Theileria equi strain WA TaxID=1537102 RepID=L1LEQ7_THEEQ|nr:hypothetical protein BEWA_036990 [Theileria equi strain WA]EKX73663.1 hypothetical protein BEWA_036990 [Theileria equi strain WA]|eukprot:XP_004833115.1 hypothetical protein BEWA_036990 [Theileria equi strain WA]